MTYFLLALNTYRIPSSKIQIPQHSSTGASPPVTALRIAYNEPPTRSTKSNLDKYSTVGKIRRDPLLPADLVAYQRLSISSNQQSLIRYYSTVRQLYEQYNLDGQNQTLQRSETTRKDLLLLRQSIKDDTQISPIDKSDLVRQITKHALIYNTQRKQPSWKPPDIRTLLSS